MTLPEIGCTTPGCDQPFLAKGLCRRHYNAHHRRTIRVPDTLLAELYLTAPIPMQERIEAAIPPQDLDGAVARLDKESP